MAVRTGHASHRKINVTISAETVTMPMYSPQEQTEFHTGIFDVVTVRQFLLGFRLVKRVTVTEPLRPRWRK